MNQLGTIRELKTPKLDRACFIYVNSESKGIIGSNNNFKFDISSLPIDKNKSYNFYVKNVYFPSNSPQITTNYNYRTIRYEIYRADTGVVQTTRTISIEEGTYSSSQLVFNVARVLNSDFGSLVGTYGGDQYTFTYDDITNRISIVRNSKNAVGGIFYNIRLLSNDDNSKYNGEPGFGLGFVLGLPYNSFLDLPADIVTTSGSAVCPNPPNLQPYLYYYIVLEGINNINVASDLPNINNIIFKAPLTIADGRYSYVFVESSNPDFEQLFVSTLPSILSIRIIDQYGNLFPLAENSAIDLTLKLVPIE
jgi:hypothetical protein